MKVSICMGMRPDPGIQSNKQAEQADSEARPRAEGTSALTRDRPKT